MRILGVAYFDPASVVLSHRNLMRAAGHDFRLAVVRAYTERQQRADWVCERLVRRAEDVAPGVSKISVFWEQLSPNLESLREFAAQADVIQFHPGIGHGDGDWASKEGPIPPVGLECFRTYEALGLSSDDLNPARREVYFVHGSRAAWSNLQELKDTAHEWGKRYGYRFATSTIDYATEMYAAYLPPLVDVGDLRAQLRGDDDPLLIAHTPTDRVACSTEDFLKAAQGLGIPVRLGEGMAHSEVLKLKAGCNVGFDHLRGAFSTNTLENAALGLVPLYGLKDAYAMRAAYKDVMRVEPQPHFIRVDSLTTLQHALRLLDAEPLLTRDFQRLAREWWEREFSAEPITKRLLKFYEGL